MNISWLYSEPFDYEYKTYVFLAFYQKALQSFKNYRLYPIKKTTDKIYSETKELEQVIGKMDDDLNPSTEVVKKLIDLSAPKLHELKEISEEMQRVIEEEIQIEKYGLEHPYRQEGILFIQHRPANYILNYKVNNVFVQEPLLDNVSLQFVATTFTRLKDYYGTILARFSEGNYIPATYRVQVPQQFPFYQSVLPVLKRKLFFVLKSSI